MSVEGVVRGTPRWADVRAEFVEAQAGCCAICREDITDAPKLDHCHVTGFIRGALCCSCNVKLGWFEGRRKEIEEYLARSAEYAAHAVLPRTPRKVLPSRTLRQSERLRKYWQAKHG